MSNTITNGNYYYSQSAFVQSAHYYSNQTFGNNDFQSNVIKKDEDSSEVVDALAKEEPAKKGYTRVITANVWNSGMTSTQLADEAMQAVDGVAPYDIFEKKNYLSELNGSINNFKMMGVSTLGAEQLLSHINRLMEVMMTSSVGTGTSPEPVENATTFAGAKVWGDTGSFGMFSGIRFQAVSYQGALSIDGAQKSVEISDNEDLDEVVTPLGGMSSIPVGNMSYVMTASEVFKPGLDNPIVRVHVGGKDIDVNINEVDPKNASAVEMFAYCQYADAHDTGTGYTFGSYSVLKGVTDPLGKSEYTSLDEAIFKKSNWNDAISGSKASFTKEQTGEKYDASILLKMLEETAGLFASQSGDKDLGELTDEEWEKLLADTDKAIDEAKETAIDNKQQEETEAEHVKQLLVENYENGKIQKAMDGYEFMKMQGELIERNVEKLRQNQKITRERLLEQDPNAASKWYMYDGSSKRYSFDEFCKFMDAKDAEPGT